MTHEATNCNIEGNPEQCSILAQKEYALAQAQARIVALEAQLATALAAPSSADPVAPNLARRYEKLLAYSRDHITLLDAQGQISYTNGTEQLLGYSNTADAGLAPLDFAHPEDRARLQAFFQTLAATPNSVQTLEVRGRHRAGHEVWLEIKGNNLLRDPDVGALVLSSRDITEAKQTLAALERSEAIFRHTFEEAAVGIAHIGRDLKLLRINQRYGEIMGYTQAELEQRGVADYTHPDDMESDRQAARRLLAGEISTYRTQKRYLHKGGGIRWVNLTVSLVRTSDGQPDFFISAVEDITQLKETEAALQRHRELYQRIIEDQLDLVCRYNTAGDLIHVNQAYAAIFGKTPAEIMGTNLFTLVYPHAQEAIRAQMGALSAADPVRLFEELVPFRTGETRWIQWVDRAFYDAEGNVVEYQSVGRDITAQKQLQQEQQRYTHAIEEMHQFLHSTLDAIAASIAVLDHDGTILNVNKYWKHFGLDNGAQSATGYYLGNYLTVCDAATGPQADEAQPVATGIRAVITGNAEHFYLEYACHSLTEERWYGLRVTPFAEPAPRRVVVAHINITERVQAELAERKQRHFAEALLDSLAALTGALDVDQALQRILAATAAVIPSDGGSIILFEADESRLAYVRGFSPEAEAYFKAARFPMTLFVGQDTIRGAPYLVSDTQAVNNWFTLPYTEWIRSSIDVPIQLKGQVIGLICVDSATPAYFQPADVEKLQAFAHYASLALQNADHVSQLERRVAERTAELQAAKEQVEAILDHSFDGILLVRPDLRIARANAVFNQLFTVTADANPAEGDAVTLNQLMHVDDRAQVQTLIQRVLASQEGEQIEIRCCQQNGTVFDAELGIGPIKGDGMVCTIRDITARKQAEAALRESEALYRLLADNITDWISRVNAKLELTYASPSARALGYELEELLGQQWLTFVHPDDLPIIYTAQMEAINHRLATLHLTYRMWHKAGYYMWIETHGRILYDAETGEMTESISVSSDISARKQMEETLRESEARYRLLADNITDMISQTNLASEFVYISPSIQALLGYAPEELLGKYLYQFMHPEDIALLQQQRNAMNEAGAKRRVTYRARHKDGHYVWVETQSTVVYNEQGAPQSVVATSRDITERKRAEEALQESEQKYRHLAETMRGGLVILDTAHRATYVNDRFCELIGYTRAEALGRPPTDFVDAENAQVLQTQFAKRVQGESSSYELVMRHKQGQPVHVIISASPMRNEQQERIGTIAVLLDIEIQKRAEAALRENLRKEQELGELKSRFVTMASHEFRTPLTAIRASAETLQVYRRKLPDEQIDKRLVKIQEQVDYLKGIIEDVLQLARLQARRAEFNPAPLDLDALCRNIIEEFQNNPEQAKRLIYESDPTLQASLVDKKLMRQVISNLLANGLKYSPVDKPVTLRLTHAAAQLLLTVQDQGIGIPAADMPHLFEPFHRASNVGNIAGTGLGLVITKESVELHGGTITVQSQSGVGTTVTVAIPYVTNGASPMQAETPPTLALREPEQTIPAQSSIS